MKPLLRSEDFYLRNIQVSSMNPNYGDPVRVGGNVGPWCAEPGNEFGEWVQVDLGKISMQYIIAYYRSSFTVCLTRKPVQVFRRPKIFSLSFQNKRKLNLVWLIACT